MFILGVFLSASRGSALSKPTTTTHEAKHNSRQLTKAPCCFLTCHEGPKPPSAGTETVFAIRSGGVGATESGSEERGGGLGKSEGPAAPSRHMALVAGQELLGVTAGSLLQKKKPPPPHILWVLSGTQRTSRFILGKVARGRDGWEPSAHI